MLLLLLLLLLFFIPLYLVVLITTANTASMAITAYCNLNIKPQLDFRLDKEISQQHRKLNRQDLITDDGFGHDIGCVEPSSSVGDLCGDGPCVADQVESVANGGVGLGHALEVGAEQLEEEAFRSGSGGLGFGLLT